MLASPRLAYALLNAYLKLGQYAEFDALCSEVDFTGIWNLSGPQSLWLARHMQEALQLMHAGKPAVALPILQNRKW